jgi:hypothetical protein
LKLQIKNAKFLFVFFAGILIFLNGLTLLAALDKTGGTQLLCSSNTCTNAGRDFSAYYEAGHRFLSDPGLVYSKGTVTLANGTVVNSQNFRYSPFFLPLFVVPLVTIFDYTHALIAFDLIQFQLLPLMAYLLYKIMIFVSRNGQRIEEKNFALFSFTLLISLLEPFMPNFSDFTFWSWSYSRLWLEGEARVLQTIFLVLTLYLVLRSSKLSGIPFVLSSFDPRMSLACLPLLLYLSIRKRSLTNFTISSLVSFVVIYAPTMLYANLGVNFLGTIYIRDFVIYAYEWIVLLTIASLTGTFLLLDGILGTAALNSNSSLIGMLLLKSRLVGLTKSRGVPMTSNHFFVNFASVHADYRYVPTVRMRYGL